MILVPGLLVIALAVFLVLRGVEVRLVLGLAALLLGLLAGNPWPVVIAFLTTMADGKFIIPICSAMGFVYVLKQAKCDEHLVHLLSAPLRRVRVLLIPGTVLVAFCVNIPIISQTSTALVVGTVLIPLLRAAGISPLTSGAALLLGASVGGELLNPGAPELLVVAKLNKTTSQECVAHVAELLPIHLPVVVGVFWILSRRAEKKLATKAASERQGLSLPSEATAGTNSSPPLQGTTISSPPLQEGAGGGSPPVFRVQLWKAVIPLIPLCFLFLVGPPFNLVEVPTSWLVGPKDAPEVFNSRLIGLAMLVGVIFAALADPSKVRQSAAAFFEGAGYGYTHIISLIVVATAFGQGVKLIALDRAFGELITAHPGLLIPAAAFMPWALAFVSGSGMASTNALYGFFVGPANAHGFDPLTVGALVSLASGAGRTMSAVAAVTLMCAKLTDTKPLDLVKRVAPPLLAGLTAVVAWRMIIG